LVDRHCLAGFRLRDGAVRAEPERCTRINVGSRDDEACVESKPVRRVTSGSVSSRERYTRTAFEQRFRGRGG
jgi:hypothetical protein